MGNLITPQIETNIITVNWDNLHNPVSIVHKKINFAVDKKQKAFDHMIITETENQTELIIPDYYKVRYNESLILSRWNYIYGLSEHVQILPGKDWELFFDKINKVVSPQSVEESITTDPITHEVISSYKRVVWGAQRRNNQIHLYTGPKTGLIALLIDLK